MTGKAHREKLVSYEFRWVKGPPDMLGRFHVDKEFSPSGTVHRDVERAQERPRVAILQCPFLERPECSHRTFLPARCRQMRQFYITAKAVQRNMLCPTCWRLSAQISRKD